MREVKRERFPKQLHEKKDEGSAISWILGGISFYFVLYLWLRDSSASFIPSFVIYALLFICLFIILGIQVKRLQMKLLAKKHNIFIRQQSNPQIGFNAYPQYQIHPMQQMQNMPYPRYPSYESAVPLGSVLPPQAERSGTRSPSFLLSNQSPFEHPLNETPTLAPVHLERSRTPLISSVPNQTDYESLSNNSLALELYDRIGIKQRIPIWIENVRYWVSYTLIPTILKRHQQNLEQLGKLLSFHNRCLVFHRLDDQPMIDLKPTLWENLYSSIMNYGGSKFQDDQNLRYLLNNEQSKANLVKLLKERARIEKYLRLKENSVAKREYVIERLKQLQANFAGEYNTTRGKITTTTWNPNVVKDSEVTYATKQ